jgi:methylmalonyl-CoA/ethylmalonyl-CoA epimerase
MRVHHIGYAVRDIEAAAEGFAALGYRRAGNVTDDPHRNVRILFVSLADGTLVELVAPLNEHAPVCGTLNAQRGVSHPYHICYETDDFDGDVALLRSRGFLLISDIAPAKAIGMRRVCFLMSNSAGLVELLEA